MSLWKKGTTDLWKTGATDICRRCRQEVEDATKARQCQCPHALTVWTQSIAHLEVWMTKQQQSQRGIIRVVCIKTLVWQRGSRLHQLVKAVCKKQNEIARHTLLQGRPSLRWSKVQPRYFQWVHQQSMTMEQDEVAWQSLLQGRPSLRWIEVQHR
jgi:hypothetical protein